MTVTQILREEHETILLVLNSLERQAPLAPDFLGGEGQLLDRLVGFFHEYVDLHHNAKEEKYLFPRMRERGVLQEHGPNGVMLKEHGHVRRLVQVVTATVPAATAGEADALAVARSAVLVYSRLLRAHIAKENAHIFPLADQVLTASDQAELQEIFERSEAEERAQGIEGKYLQLARDLAGPESGYVTE